MTSHAQSRCHHCSVRFFYQASGYGCDEPTNRKDYCPDCAQVVVNALASVPRRVPNVPVDLSEAHALELEAIEKELDRIAKEAGTIRARRVGFPLFDLVDPSNVNRAGITRVDGVLYHWDYWTKDPEGTSHVRVPMEKDLVTGVLVPWENIR